MGALGGQDQNISVLFLMSLIISMLNFLFSLMNVCGAVPWMAHTFLPARSLKSLISLDSASKVSLVSRVAAMAVTAMILRRRKFSRLVSKLYFEQEETWRRKRRKRDFLHGTVKKEGGHSNSLRERLSRIRDSETCKDIGGPLDSIPPGAKVDESLSSLFELFG